MKHFVAYEIICLNTFSIRSISSFTKVRVSFNIGDVLMSYFQDPRNTICGWDFTPQELQNAINSKLMINPSIDLTNACNLNCPYCYIEEKDSQRKMRRTGELTFDETIRVIDDLEETGAKTINLVGAGEPTIDPHFEEVVNYISNLGLTTVLFTNGIRINNQPEIAKFLYDRKVSIILKYNSTHAQTQDLVAGRTGYSNKRDKALDILIDYGFTSSSPTRLGLDTIVFNGNCAEIPKIHSWCRKLNIFPIAGEYIPTGRTDYGEFQGYDSIEVRGKEYMNLLSDILRPISEKQRIWLLKELREIDKAENIHWTDSFSYYGGGQCTQILGLYIDIQGHIWPCVARKKKVGDKLQNGELGRIRNGDLPSLIWKTNPYLQMLRNEFNGGCPYKPALVLCNISS